MTLKNLISLALETTGIRHSWLFEKLVRPIYEWNLMRIWWIQGRKVPPPHLVKVITILFWADHIGAEIIVETGTYKGDIVRALHPRFRRTITIELAPKLAARVRHEFRRTAGIEVITGDSGVELERVIPTLDAPTVFWLDAHYSGPRTAGREGLVPIFAEIDRISRELKFAHVVIIDDMRLFNGSDGYPTQAELMQRLKLLKYNTVYSNDMLQAVMT
jgi:hypothetical protein